MARADRRHGVPVVVMHNRDSVDPDIDIMADIAAFFSRSLEIAAKAGISQEHIVLDPGIGFGKTAGAEHDGAGTADEFDSSGSRSWSAPRASASSPRCRPSEPDQRLGGSIAAHLIAAQARRADHPHP